MQMASSGGLVRVVSACTDPGKEVGAPDAVGVGGLGVFAGLLAPRRGGRGSTPVRSSRRLSPRFGRMPAISVCATESG